MLPFRVALVSGQSPFRQIVYAATRAIVAGDLAPGSSFPSVRELSQALKINPNTAQKVVAELQRDGMIEVRPGVGTVVSSRRRSSPAERRTLLSADVEKLIVEARRLGIDKDDVLEAIGQRWDTLFAPSNNASR